jgi:uncharacterized protein YPO0396
MSRIPDAEAGFRLSRMELYNWGTFHEAVWTMRPEGKTAVLTGLNGSGKSTVVDALLTMLVESRQRNYNLASSANSSRERTERSYILGQYSRYRDENTFDSKGKANTLRGIDSHTVLLAVFEDSASDKVVTLAQILWISNADKIEHRYYVATMDLNIEQHFPQRHVNSRDLPGGVQLFNNVFKDYIAAARKALGLSGRPKALDLFNQTVAVKDIPSLNQFVRDHMLDKGKPEAQVETLRAQYRELNDAYDSIQRAERQLSILGPLVKAAEDFRRYEEQIQRYEVARQIVPYYVAFQAQGMLNDAITRTQSQHDAEQSRLDVLDRELQQQRDDLERVKFAIAQDSIGQMKRELELKRQSLEREINALKPAARRYDEQAQRLGLPLYQHEADFHTNRLTAQSRRAATVDSITDLESQRETVQAEQRELIARGQALDQEIQYLRQHPSNIPEQVARIRQQISRDLDIALSDLPFVGELLKVRDEDLEWQGSLERLLNGFAQDLIVHESLYQPISRYVNEKNLRGRLVYRRVDPDRPADRQSDRRGGAVNGPMAYEKVHIRPDTPYEQWLGMSLQNRFNYACCDSLGEFQRAERAITRQGQIKHSISHHEKDDRRDLTDKRHYVLGWDNREKLQQLETELDDISRKLNRLQENLTQIKNQLAQYQTDVQSLDALLSFTTFAEIDWRTPQAEFDQTGRQLADLSQQAQQLKQLEQDRDRLERAIREAEERKREIIGNLRSFGDQIKEYRGYLDDAEKLLAGITEDLRPQWEIAEPVLAPLSQEPLTIKTLSTQVDRLDNSLQRSISSFRGIQNGHQAVILDAMNSFRREYPDMGVSLSAHIESLPDYLSIYEQIQTDDLPRYKERFKDMLTRKVTRGVMAFSSHLTEQEKEIERSIAELNESLAQVDYGNGSVIRLLAERSPDPEINEFRRELLACLPNVGDSSPEELERAYSRIKLLIERFDKDANWMARVIDVRRWRIFAAEQISPDGRQLDYYSDSSGKSGGQKAKLAYTILGSAIAYQYGLQELRNGERSFRFVVIDEAFSKLDDDNARYAMRLFDQLGLQLMVVTPMQQLRVLEEFVHAYHLVTNPNGNHSSLFNLTQAQYHQQRQNYLGTN